MVVLEIRNNHLVKGIEMSFMTTNEVAELVRTSPETVRYWRHVGNGPKSFKVGRRVLYERAAVLSWIEEAQASAR